MTKRLLAVGIAFSACAILVAGCGGGGSSRLSAADYKARITLLGKDAAKAQTVVGEALRAKTVSDIGTGVAAFADAEDKLGDEVTKTKAPKNADAANAKLAKGLHDLATEIRELLPDLGKQTSTKAAIAFLNKNLNGAPGSRAIGAALAELKKLGYTTGK